MWETLRAQRGKSSSSRTKSTSQGHFPKTSVLEEEESDYNVVIFEYALDIMYYEKQCFNKRTFLFVHTNTNG